MNNTAINLHGILGDEIGKNWNLSVKTVGESIHAINTLTKGKLNKFLFDNDKKGVKYSILINNIPFEADEKAIEENPEEIKNTELALPIKNLKSIDILPVLEGASGDIGSIGAIIAGIALIVIGIVLSPFTFGLSLSLIPAGIGLIAAGVLNLLTQPPSFKDYQEIQGSRRSSYLLNGPENTVKEGLPVPIPYGELLIGSAVLQASYEITDIPIDSNETTI